MKEEKKEMPEEEGRSFQQEPNTRKLTVTFHSLSHQLKAPAFPLLGPRLLHALSRFGTPTAFPTFLFLSSDWLIEAFHAAPAVSLTHHVTHKGTRHLAALLRPVGWLLILKHMHR